MAELEIYITVELGLLTRKAVQACQIGYCNTYVFSSSLCEIDNKFICDVHLPRAPKYEKIH
jgi:hypothetical protein